MKLEHFKSFFILGYISVNQDVSFMELKNTFNMSDGAISGVTSRLSNQGLIKINKTFDFNKTRTTYEITMQGRFVIQDFIDILNMYK